MAGGQILTQADGKGRGAREEWGVGCGVCGAVDLYGLSNDAPCPAPCKRPSGRKHWILKTNRLTIAPIGLSFLSSILIMISFRLQVAFWEAFDPKHRPTTMDPLFLGVLLNDVSRIGWMVFECGGDLNDAYVALPDIPRYFQVRSLGLDCPLCVVRK